MSGEFAGLFASRREELLRRLRERRVAERRPIVRRSVRPARIPLSYPQQRLWFLEQAGPGQAVYHVPFVARLRGDLDAGALRAALAEVVRRHEALRTVYRSVDGVPHQVVLPPAGTPLPVTDVPGETPRDRWNAAVRTAEEECGRPFDLERGPVLRARLLRLEPREHVLVVVIHHIAVDAWSMGVLASELSALYRSFVDGRPSPLPEPAIQYADVALWQRERLEGEREAREADFWQERLRDLTPLRLPTDRPRSRSPRSPGAALQVDLPSGTGRLLAEVSARLGVTPYALALAAFAALLARSCGQDDVVVGAVTTGRTAPETRPLVGFFVNTLPLRIDLSGDPTFEELVRRTAATVLEAHRHQELPFERMVELLHPPGRAEGSPVFRVMFDLLRESPALHLPGLEVEEVAVEVDGAKSDLSITVLDGEPARCQVEYRTDLFDRETAERAGRHYGTLLEAALADPGRPISALLLMGPSERRRMLEACRGPRIDPPDALVHELFERQARRTPEAVAVVAGRERVTYRTLDARSNALAARLRELGAGPERVVGAMLRRSPSLVVAMLATLKAGAAFMPVDPGLPRRRVEAMLRDADCSLVVSTRRDRDRVPPRTGRVLCLDGEDEPAAGPAPAQPRPAPAPSVPRDDLDALAYVPFTSGSTGVPKGVMVSHRSLANAFAAWDAVYGLAERPPTVLQMADLSFDVFAADLLRALLSGGRLVICPRETVLQPEDLYDLMVRERVDCADFVPASFRLLADHVEATGRSLRFLRLLVVGAEAWTGGEFERARRLTGPGTRVLCAYGLTEATIDSSYYEAGAGTRLRPEATVPIGRPFPNTDLYVLDRRLEPVPLGVEGELHVAGPGLARGYLGRPDLTAERFVPNPHADRPGERLYATGDRVRLRPDGNLEYLGRTDRQVKVRGFRIELGAIEAAMHEHPMVADVAVVAREDRPGERRVVAYVVASCEVPTAELRTHLGDRLPAYMVPAAFVRLARLPRNRSGKLDVRALPQPDPSAGSEDPVPPRTETERLVARVWAEALDLSALGVHDGFFDLGGHSLLATRVVSRLRSAFGVPLPVWELMEHPTVAGVAAAVERLRREAGSEPATPASGSSRSRRPAGPHPFLVTGGTGATGSFVVERLRRAGLPVRVLARPESAARVVDAEPAIGDLADADSVHVAARDAGGVVHVASTFTRPEVDLAAMQALLDGWDRGPFVFVSSVDVYADAPAGLLDESHPLDGSRSAYAETKVRCEDALRREAARRDRTDFAILRPSFVWGPHPTFRGQLAWGATRDLYQAVARGEPIVLPGGGDEARGGGEGGDAPGDGEGLRRGDGWIDARDLARVVQTCLRHPPGEAINAVAGHFAWEDLCRVLVRLLRSRSEIRHDPSAGGPFGRPWLPSGERLRRLGFRPRHRWPETLADTLAASEADDG